VRLKELINLEKFREYFNKNDTFSINSGMKLVELGEGYSKVELTIDEDGMNYMGTMHGGLLYTMADVAAGTALVFRGKQAVTLSAYMEFIKPVTSGNVVAVCRATAIGKTIGRCAVDVCGEDGKIYCKTNVTMFITDKAVLME
jgi:acyl-CoA thioesterase